MRKRTIIKFISMAKRVISVLQLVLLGVVLVAMCAPCLLMFSEGRDGELTVWNVVGLAWAAALAWAVGRAGR